MVKIINCTDDIEMMMVNRLGKLLPIKPGESYNQNSNPDFGACVALNLDYVTYVTVEGNKYCTGSIQCGERGALIIGKDKNGDIITFPSKLATFGSNAGVVEKAKLKAYSEDSPGIKKELTKLPISNEIEYPFVSYDMAGQSEVACKLTLPENLPSNLFEIYKIDKDLKNIYATRETLLVGVQACIFAKNEGIQVTVTSMSGPCFGNRPDTPNSMHNFGMAFDIKIAGRMLSNGSDYDRISCLKVGQICLKAGAKRIIFGDQSIVDQLNHEAGKKVAAVKRDHENHIHMDLEDSLFP